MIKVHKEQSLLKKDTFWLIKKKENGNAMICLYT